MANYYVLAQAHDLGTPAARWVCEFGDYDRSVVEAELDEYPIDERIEMRVVQVNGDTQADIDRALGNFSTEVKEVQIELAALTRLTYMQKFTVLADTSDSALEVLAEDLYDKVDGGDYTDDPHYWQRGSTTIAGREVK